MSHPIRTAAIALALPLAAACGGSEPAIPAAEPTASVRPASTTIGGSPGGPVSAIAVAEPVPATFEDAEQALRAGRYGEAARGFDAYTSRKPENVWGWYMLGLAQWKSGDAEGAVLAFDSALARDPEHLKSLYNSGRALLDAGRAREALDRFEAAVAVDSAAAEGWRLLGRGFQEIGDLEAAVSSYRQALVLDEHDAWALNNLGVLHLEEGRARDAIGPLARAVEVRPSSPIFRNNLGNALERAGYPAAAKAAYGTALEADSSYAKARVNLERVGALVPEGTTPEVDVAHLAEEFRFLIRVWRDGQ
jgi:tetratricopeptide (TPR) repeat protein